MKRYRKLIAAAVGLAAILLGPEFAGLVGNEETFAQSAIAMLTALGIYGVRNEED